MSSHKIFLITPLGNKNSPKRNHADKMWNNVFKYVSDQLKKNEINCDFIRSDLLKESGNSRIREIMNLIRESRGCIVDLYEIGNLNVMYEIGLAHSQGKRVFFLRSSNIKEDEIPSDIRYYADYYYSYNLEIFDSDASSEEISNISKTVFNVASAMVSANTNYQLYRPVFYERTEQYMTNVLETINSKIANLEKLMKDFGTSSEDERTLAQYIIGENEAFESLTNAIKKSTISVKTTRFSSYSVVDRQNNFFNTINDLMSNYVHPNNFERIITANNLEKFPEVAKLMVNNAGKNFDIYISKIEYSFEMVVIDDEIVFIHFRKYNHLEGDINSSPTLISSTLKIEKRIIANEFSTIFDSIKNNSKDILCVIHCNEITNDNLVAKIDEYKKIFSNAVKDYQGSTDK